MIAEMNAPISTVVFGLPLRIWKPRPTLLPVKLWTIGLMMLVVNEVMRALNARATTSPTATTMTSPRRRKFLKPLIYLFSIRDTRGGHPRTPGAGHPFRNCVAPEFMDMPYDSGSRPAAQPFPPSRDRPDLRFSGRRFKRAVVNRTRGLIPGAAAVRPPRGARP